MDTRELKSLKIMEDLFCCCSLKKNSNVERTKSHVSVPIEGWDLVIPDEEAENVPKDTDDEQDSTSIVSLFKKIFRASPDNKLALKLYGNKQGIIKEQNRQDSNFCSRWMIHPFSHFRLSYSKHI